MKSQKLKKDHQQSTKSHYGATTSEQSEQRLNTNSTSFQIARVFQGVKQYLSTGTKEEIPERLETDDISEKSIDSQEELIVVSQHQNKN